ncbi:MAG: hypothetical protein BWX70_03546 [Verrucomicrobia bacterium ADurb.Bin070]|nr:MAG: hypothetical protein BWX70_03546 [Verrucomicrobia bacterium ADurb.Bin070]
MPLPIRLAGLISDEALERTTSRFSTPDGTGSEANNEGSALASVCGRLLNSPCFFSKMRARRGRRMSKSTSSVRCPLCAQEAARLHEVTVLPSPGWVLMQSTTLDIS